MQILFHLIAENSKLSHHRRLWAAPRREARRLRCAGWSPSPSSSRPWPSRPVSPESCSAGMAAWCLLSPLASAAHYSEPAFDCERMERRMIFRRQRWRKRSRISLNAFWEAWLREKGRVRNKAGMKGMFRHRGVFTWLISEWSIKIVNKNWFSDIYQQNM